MCLGVSYRCSGGVRRRHHAIYTPAQRFQRRNLHYRFGQRELERIIGKRFRKRYLKQWIFWKWDFREWNLRERHIRQWNFEQWIVR